MAFIMVGQTREASRLHAGQLSLTDERQQRTI
jgi:hypothetical protein